MCGIAGIVATDKSFITRERLQQMTDVLSHRGPDGEGFWINETEGVALGHRRLAIIDLSDAAVQPLYYLNRYTIVHNGEIYNYRELRDELQKRGYGFTSLCDTEVIAAAYDFWKEECLQHFDGMFAFAIWDSTDQQLFAARDRFGEKPFYYTWDDESNILIFASEMKALWAAGVQKEINHTMLLNYITNGLVQNPVDKSETFYHNISSLPPSCYLSFSIRHSSAQLKNYWDIDKRYKLEITETEATEKFMNLLETSVKRRLRSDVPLGSSLSGGLDSSSIVAMIQQAGDSIPGNKLQTFSAVFPGFHNDESKYINILCNKFQINSHTVTPSAEGFIHDFEKLCYHQEEPFTSSSIYAQYKVFETASENNIKVLLDGQGADETLAGYNKYIHWFLQELLAKQPNKFMRERVALRKNKVPFEWGWRNYLATILPAQAAVQLEKKAWKTQRNHPAINKEYIAEYGDKSSLYKPLVLRLNDILYYNTLHFGLEELLRYADRNAMAHGCEVRLPFLSHELVEFIFSLPPTLKIHKGFTKYILRVSMQQSLPSEIVWRTDKVGYEPPQQQWMQQSKLQEYIHNSKSVLVNAGILQNKVLNEPVQPQGAHEAGNNDWRYLIAGKMIEKTG